MGTSTQPARMTTRFLVVAVLYVASFGFADARFNHDFTNCGAATDPVKVNSIDLKPDPVVAGKPLLIAINSTINQQGGVHNMTGGHISVGIYAFGTVKILS